MQTTTASKFSKPPKAYFGGPSIYILIRTKLMNSPQKSIMNRASKALVITSEERGVVKKMMHYHEQKLNAWA